MHLQAQHFLSKTGRNYHNFLLVNLSFSSIGTLMIMHLFARPIINITFKSINVEMPHHKLVSRKISWENPLFNDFREPKGGKLRLFNDYAQPKISNLDALVLIDESGCFKKFSFVFRGFVEICDLFYLAGLICSSSSMNSSRTEPTYVRRSLTCGEAPFLARSGRLQLRLWRSGLM